MSVFVEGCVLSLSASQRNEHGKNKKKKVFFGTIWNLCGYFIFLIIIIECTVCLLWRLFGNKL